MWTGGESGRVSRRALLRTAGLIGATGLAVLPRAAIGAVTPPAGTGFYGQAIDLATLQPVAGALVQAEPAGGRVVADHNGVYVLPLPPGTYTVRVSKDSYIGVIRLRQVVGTGSYTNLDLDLVPASPTQAQQETLYQRMVTQKESPPPTAEELTLGGLSTLSTSLPTQIQVYYDMANPPYSVWVPLEDYVKGVVPNEVFPSWPAAALQAQAVAARTYGVKKQLTVGYVYPDTRDQVYDPTRTYPTTDAAVDATAGQVMTYGGSVIYAFFFSRCNGMSTRNSENAITLVGGCPGQGFSYTPYCRARCCTWNEPYPQGCLQYNGHGVGMCQWGVYGQANAGRSYTTILNSYYTGITLATGSIASASAQLSTSSSVQGTYQLYLPLVTNNSCS